MQLALRWMSKFSPLVTRTVLLRRNKIWSLHQKVLEQAFSSPSSSAIVLARLSNKFASGWHAGCRWGIPRIHVLDAAPDEAKATRPWAVSAATQSFRNLQDLFQIEVWLKKLFTQHCSSSLARVGLGARNSQELATTQHCCCFRKPYQESRWVHGYNSSRCLPPIFSQFQRQMSLDDKELAT